MADTINDPEEEAVGRVEQALIEGVTELSFAGLPITRIPASLTTLKNLTSLDLSDCPQIEDLQPLQALSQLTSLNLIDCPQIQDLRPLQALSQLTSLDLRGCPQIQDLRPLQALSQLTSLDLRGCPQIQDLRPLQALSQLTSLNLSDCPQIQDLRPLQALSQLTSLDLRGCPQIQDLRPLQALSQLTSLDLRGCPQIQDLRPLQALSQLNSLYLSYCSQIQDLQPLQALSQLTSLNLGGCPQVQDLQPLQALSQLTSLNLGGCPQVQDLQPLQALSQLTSLDLRGCEQVQDLQPLQALSQLTSLNLSYCSQIQDLKPLQALSQLTSLNLSYCSQIQDLQPLQGLSQLTSLHLSGCPQIQDLQPLQALSQLTSLDLNGCPQIQDLQPLQALSQLTSLNLSYCSQIQDLQPLQGLSQLTSLHLSYCPQIQDLRPLQALTKLQSLHLFGLLLDCSPATAPLSSWTDLEKLYIDTVSGVPSELASEYQWSNALPRIRAWQNDLISGEASNSTIKLLILGNGRVGKTQIRERLLGREYDPAILSTHGIGLENFQLAPAQGDYPAVQAKLWDFGGQSIYLGTHGLFLDDRAVYIIAWSPHYENTHEVDQGSGVVMRNRPLTYWLEYVRSLAGPGAPIIVCQTQCDREINVQPPPLPLNHGFDRLRATYSSARVPDGIERLQLELKSAARYQLDRYGKVRLPLSWCAVAEDLHARKDAKTISYSEFEELCRTKHNTAASSAVLEYLHRSGQVFYRPGIFNNEVVLDLDWALDGIYAVLDRRRAFPVIRNQAGRFSSQLLSALVWQQYTEAEHALFISLMQQCQICFEVAKDMYIAPALLPSEREASPAIEQIWRATTPNAIANLNYPFLHEGVLRAMLCGLGRKAGVNAVYWSYGICFYDLETKCVARIRSELADPTGRNPAGTITVEASGEGSFALAQHLVQSIAQLQAGSPPQVVWSKGESTTATPRDRDESTALSEQFASVNPGPFPLAESEPQPVYVSYAWGGESENLVDEFQAKLPRQFRLWRDKNVMRPGDRIGTMMQDIGRAEFILIVFSQKYLESPYCMQELLHIYNRSLGRHEDFLSRVVFLKLDDFRCSRTIDRIKHIKHWQQEDKELTAALADIDTINLSPADQDERLAIKDFAHRISQILSWVAEVLMSRGADLHTKGVDEAINLILQRSRIPSPSQPPSSHSATT